MDWIIPSDNKVQDFASFVYRITIKTTGQWYLGKKAVWVTKAGVISRESDWQSYWGSSKDFKALVKQHGASNCTREILHLCESRGKAGYLETVELIKRDALLDPHCLNGNIAERWNRTVVQGWHSEVRCARYSSDLQKALKNAGLNNV